MSRRTYSRSRRARGVAARVKQSPGINTLLRVYRGWFSSHKEKIEKYAALVEKKLSREFDTAFAEAIVQGGKTGGVSGVAEAMHKVEREQMIMRGQIYSRVATKLSLDAIGEKDVAKRERIQEAMGAYVYALETSDSEINTLAADRQGKAVAKELGFGRSVAFFSRHKAISKKLKATRGK